MRVNVASIGGRAGVGGWGFARSRSARYSSTGSTTQPSGVGVWAFPRSVLASAHTTTVMTNSRRLIASSLAHDALARATRTHRFKVTLATAPRSELRHHLLRRGRTAIG